MSLKPLRQLHPFLATAIFMDCCTSAYCWDKSTYVPIQKCLVVQAPTRELTKKDESCLSGTSAGRFSKWGWASVHNRAGKLLPKRTLSVSRCAPDLLLSVPTAASAVTLTEHCAEKLIFLEFAWIIPLTNVCRVFAPLVLKMIPMSLKLVAIKSYK